LEERLIKLNLIEPAMLTVSEDDHMRWICSAIAAGLAPWKPGKITAYYTDELAGVFTPFNPIVTFETELLPRLPFSAQIDLLTMDHHQALLKVADEAFVWFRYRHAVSVDDHIILGED
jgi:hypothetical protein